jgi:hypothetical protein
LDAWGQLAFGPDGNLYVSNWGGSDVLRIDAATGNSLGEFVPAGDHGLTNSHGLTFGPDGDLYVVSQGTNSVLRYDGLTGAFLNVFVPPVHLNGPTYLTFWDTGGDSPIGGGGAPSHHFTASPAHAAGLAPDESVVADQRGMVRSGGVNIGAYQASASTFELTAPASVTAGTPFDLTVRAKDSFGQPAAGYTDTVHLSSSEGQAVLPDDHTFTLTDGGSYTFSGVALRTAGTWTVTATAAGTLTGSGTVTVRPAAANHILLSGPASASASTPFDLVVTIENAYGNTVTDYAGTVTFSTDDPNGSVPPDYTFTTDDAGTHTFVGGVTLYADGSRVTATDTQQDSLSGSVVVPLG